MATRLKLNTAGFKAMTRRQMEAGIAAATVDLHRIARKKAGIPNPGVTVTSTRARAGGNKSSRTEYPTSSRPGESPRRRTGFGQKGIVMGVHGLEGRVGYTRLARYMTFHELGIRYHRSGGETRDKRGRFLARGGIQRRPTIVPALKRNRARLILIMKRAAQAKR